MAKIDTVDNVVRTRTLQKLKQYDGVIKAEVAKEAKRRGYDVTVKKIEFVSVSLPQKEVQDIRFGKMTINEKNAEVVLYSLEYDNNSDTTDSAEFSYDQQRADSWHWQLTAGVSFKYTAEAKVPELATVSKSVQIDFSASYGEAAQQTKSWRWRATPQIPPHSRVIVHAVLKQVAGSVPITCRLKVDGSVRCRATLGVKWVPDQQREFDIPLQRLLSDAERTYTTEGVISGASGLDAKITKDQELPLTAPQRRTLPAGLNRRELPSTFSLGRLKLRP